MKVMGLEIPQAALDAGAAAMAGEFRSSDVAGAVSVVLHDLYHEEPAHEHFDFGGNDKFQVADRTADRLIQNARKTGRIRFSGGTWKVKA